MILPIQMASYCVPLLTPHLELGRAVCQEAHDSNQGESAASTQARASCYWHHQPAAMTYFKQLAQVYFKCRQILTKRGQNVISPLRNIGELNLVKGANLMIDICGPF